MEGSEPSLTQFLLDLTEDEELRAAFHDYPDPIITSRGLHQYGELLKRGDVPGLRYAVRAEAGGHWADEPVPGVRKPPEALEEEEPEAIIAGVRVPGVREPPPPDEPLPGVREPPPDEPVPGVREPPSEPMLGVREPPGSP